MRTRETWMFALVLTLAFLAVGLTNVLTHEIWADEGQAWLLARDSGTLVELVQNARYEGHPAMWYLCLYAITRFSHEIAPMQVFHILVAAAGALVFLKWSPFSRLAKTLFVFGYFPLFGYGTISRNYAFGVLFLWIFCALAGRRRRNYLLLSLPLFMMMQSNMYALLLAASLAGMLVFEAWRNRDVRALLAARKGAVIAGIAVVVAGVALSILQTYPPADSTCYPHWRTGFYPGAVARVLSSAWEGYVPVPRLTMQFWGTNIVPWMAVRAGLGLVLLGFGAWFFRRRRPILFLYLFSALAMLGIKYAKTFGGLRHHGHFFLILVACLWLMRRDEQSEAQEGEERYLGASSEKGKRLARLALIAFFGLHAAVGVYVSVMDWLCPFSPAKATADYIRLTGREDAILAGCEPNRMCPVVAYLDTTYFQLHGCRWGSYRKYATWANPDYETFYKRLAEMQAAQKKDILLVLTPLDSAPPGFVKIADFPPIIINDEEHYILYLREYEPWNASRSKQS